MFLNLRPSLFKLITTSSAVVMTIAFFPLVSGTALLSYSFSKTEVHEVMVICLLFLAGCAPKKRFCLTGVCTFYLCGVHGYQSICVNALMHIHIYYLPLSAINSKNSDIPTHLYNKLLLGVQ